MMTNFSDRQKKTLVLFNHPDHKHYLNELYHSGKPSNLQFVAKHGKDEHRKKLRTSPSYTVRQAVAKYGNDEDREKLLKDKCSLVRMQVGRSGNEKHARFLLKDKNPWVSELAENRLRQLGIDPTK